MQRKQASVADALNLWAHEAAPYNQSIDTNLLYPSDLTSAAARLIEVVVLVINQSE